LESREPDEGKDEDEEDEDGLDFFLAQSGIASNNRKIAVPGGN